MARDCGHTREGSPERLLLVWLSPSFPVGAYAYSHGLEAAVAQGLVADRAGLEQWLRDLIRCGSLMTDLIVVRAAWLSSSDAGALDDVNALALALQPSRQRYLETTQQGMSFLEAIAAAWPCSPVAALLAGRPDAVAYPVAVGVAAAGHGISLDALLPAYGLAFTQNLVSAAIRLSVIGQTDGQRVIAALLPDIGDSVETALVSTLDDIGTSTLSSDLAALEHETLYSRLFRS